MNPKEIAAARAVAYVQDGMTVGLGTGSTAAYAVTALADRLRVQPLSLRCVATSAATLDLARAHGLPLLDWEEVRTIDLTIDGADEVDPEFRLIKGGGGALVREKLVAAVTATEVIVVDATKVKPALGEHPLPVAVVPFAWQTTRNRLEEQFHCPVAPRLLPSGALFQSDDGLHVLDMAFGAPLSLPDLLEQQIKSTVGVVEVGLFLRLCHRLVIGFPDGRIEEKTPAPLVLE